MKSFVFHFEQCVLRWWFVRNNQVCSAGWWLFRPVLKSPNVQVRFDVTGRTKKSSRGKRTFSNNKHKFYQFLIVSHHASTTSLVISHLASSFIIRHLHIFSSILVWSTPFCFSFGPSSFVQDIAVSCGCICSTLLNPVVHFCLWGRRWACTLFSQGSVPLLAFRSVSDVLISHPRHLDDLISPVLHQHLAAIEHPAW